MNIFFLLLWGDEKNQQRESCESKNERMGWVEMKRSVKKSGEKTSRKRFSDIHLQMVETRKQYSWLLVVCLMYIMIVIDSLVMHFNIFHPQFYVH